MIRTIAELKAWCDDGKGRVVAYLAARGGGPSKTAVAVLDDDRGEEGLWTSMVAETVKCGRATRDFVIVELGDEDAEIRREKVRIDRDASSVPGEGTSVDRFLANLVASSERKDARMIEMTCEVSKGAERSQLSLVGALDKMGARLEQHEKMVGDLLEAQLKMSMLQLEREREAAQAAQRTALLMGGLQTLGPVLESIVNKMMKHGPDRDLEALLNSFTDDELMAWEARLRPEQRVIWEDIVAKRAEKKKHANGAPPKEATS